MNTLRNSDNVRSYLLTIATYLTYRSIKLHKTRLQFSAFSVIPDDIHHVCIYGSPVHIHNQFVALSGNCQAGIGSYSEPKSIGISVENMPFNLRVLTLPATYRVVTNLICLCFAWSLSAVNMETRTILMGPDRCLHMLFILDQGEVEMLTLMPTKHGPSMGPVTRMVSISLLFFF